MKIETLNCGNIEIGREDIIEFKEGLPGFPWEKEFIIILVDDNHPLSFLQSVKTPELSFAIINPFEIYNDYDFTLSDSVQKALKIESKEEVAVYTLLTIPENVGEMTTNLMAPLIINARERLGRQIILEGDKYTTKHYVLNQELRARKEGK